MALRKTIFGQNKLMTNGLFLYLDAGNSSSYSGSGTNWYDLSGNNNHFFLVNSPVFNSANLGSLLFNGTDNYAQLNFSKYAKDYTIITWVKIVALKVAGAVVSSGKIPTKFTFIQLGNTLRPLQFNAAYLSSTPAPVNEWMMVSGTQQGMSQKLFLNSALLASGTTLPENVLKSPLNIGRRVDGIYLNCYVSIVKIYGRALTSAEITTEFNNYKTRYGL